MSSSAVAEALSRWADVVDDLSFDDGCNLLGDLENVRTLSLAMELDVIANLLSHDEHKSLHDYLCIHVGLTRKVAKERVRVADALQSLPLLRTAFRNGQIDWGRLVLVVQLCDSPEDDALYARTARDLSQNQLQVMLKRKKSGDVSKARAAHANRSARFTHFDDEQRSKIVIWQPIDTGIAIENAVKKRADACGIDPETGEYPSRDHAMADAVCELVLGKKGPRAELLVDLQPEALVGEGKADLQGHTVCKETLQRLACDGASRASLIDEKGLPIALGRRQRLFPPHLSRLLAHRDRGCRFPGCGNTQWIHDHHLFEWDAEDGPTNYDNGLQLCGTHHRFVHEGRWKIRGNPDEALTFVRPDGKEFSGLPPATATKLQTMMFAMATDSAARVVAERERLDAQLERERLEREAEWRRDREELVRDWIESRQKKYVPPAGTVIGNWADDDDVNTLAHPS
jgi:hypothetical protein